LEFYLLRYKLYSLSLRGEVRVRGIKPYCPLTFNYPKGYHRPLPIGARNYLDSYEKN